MTNQEHEKRNSIEARVAELEARIAGLARIAGETLFKLIVCPHEVYGWNHPKHNCKECDSYNADYCFCWEAWLKERLIKAREEK